MATPAVVKTSTPDSVAGNPINVVTVNQGSGSGDQELVTLADPTTPGNFAQITAAGALKTDASATTQPVSGTVNVGNLPATQPVSGTVGLTAGQGVELLDGAGTNKAAIDSTGRIAVDTEPFTSTTGSLTALNSTVAQATLNRPCAGVYVVGSQSFVGTLVVEWSADNGATWDTRFFFNGDAWVTGDTLPNGSGPNVRTYSVDLEPTDTNLRVRVFAYTSGTLTATVAVSNQLATATRAFPIGLDQGLFPGGSFDTTPLFSMAVGGGDENSPRQHRSVQVVGATPAQADWGFVVRPVNQSRNASGTLGALNAAVQVSVEGYHGAQCQITSSSFVGTIVAEGSTDGGTTWNSTTIIDSSLNQVVGGLVNPSSQTFSVFLGAGVRLLRIRVSAYTSGSLTVNGFNATSIINPIMTQSFGVDGTSSIIFGSAVGGVDGSDVFHNLRQTAKGTQGAFGLATQELHDAGRNTRIFMLDTITAAPVTEALASVVQWYGNAAVATTTTPAVVPTGKTLRLTGYKIQYQSLSTVGYAVVRIRANTGGTVVLASPLVASFEAGTNSGATTTAVTGAVTVETGDFPDGLELPAGTGIGFTTAGYGPTGTLTLEGGVRFQVFGYEY